MSNVIYDELEKGDIVFYARILPKNNYYKVMDLRIVSIHQNYCTATDLKSKQTYPFDREVAEQVLFFNKKDALDYLNRRRIKINNSEME